MFLLRRLFLWVVVIAITVCGVWGGTLAAVAHAQTLSAAERAALQKEYDALQQEIAAEQKVLDATRAQKNTLTGDVTQLNAQIKKAQAQIDAQNIRLKQLGSQIVQKTQTISLLSNRIARGHESLASMLRQQNALDEYSIAEIALSADTLSTFFADVDAFASIEESMQALFTDIKTAKAQTESEKAALTDTQNQVSDARYDIQNKQKKVESDKTVKQQLLAITTNQEATYQKVLAEKQAKAAAIRAALFPLRDSAAIPFGTALQYAQQAEAKTGVRAAFMLAILTQESNLGANVGQCYLSNDTTGAGVGKNTGTVFANVMSPTRDVPPFLSLATQLGFDAHHQVVSCPIAGAGGWGGAMGPAQFIASTWAGIAARIASVTGHSVPNPWAADDAVAAMGIFLEDLGAGAGTYTAEHTAAARYYAGGAWATAGQAYGNSVMAKAAAIQQNIDFLADN